MHNAISVAKDTWWVGVNDHETDLFESLWDLPQGVSYNAYVVVGEKTVAIDTVKGPWFGEYLYKLESVLKGRSLDYLVVNHMEPDHSGLVSQLRLRYPDVTLIGNVKTLPMLKGYYGIETNTLEVKDGQTLDIGGHVLQFATIPMVHWPESMVTFDTTTGVLFSNDAFGGYGVHEGNLFDDTRAKSRWMGEMQRYYATIVGRYSNVVQSALKKLGGLDINCIYPSHGTLFRRDVQQVIDLYDRWSRCEAECGAVVIYGSMYGNTKRMAEAVCTGLSDGGVQNIHLYDSARAGFSFIVSDVWRYSGLILLSCTYNTLLFPPMESICSKLLNRMPKNRFLGIAGSYSWSRGALDALRDFAEKSKFERVGPEVEVFASPTEADLNQCMELGGNMARRIGACPVTLPHQ
ncbi:MAG: FprA family A-type flavoprotein [Fretibacterium sp.]|nr:FprA family A-type flavoprotein [Fretibacterium sp.]